MQPHARPVRYTWCKAFWHTKQLGAGQEQVGPSTNGQRGVLAILSTSPHGVGDFHEGRRHIPGVLPANSSITELGKSYVWAFGPPGRRLRLGTQEMQTPWLTIIGEVAAVKESSPDALTKEQWYQPVEQVEKSIGSFASPTDLNGNGGYIAIRTALEEQIANALRATVRSIDPQLPLAQVQSMEHALSDSEAPRRFNTALISAFAVAAVLLATLGIYSVIAFSAALRAQEMAIRIALGSQRSAILGLVFRSAAKLAIAGCAVGLFGAGVASHFLRSFLFDVSPFDPLVLAVAAVFVLMLALAASVLPARRAASIDPMNALRAD